MDINKTIAGYLDLPLDNVQKTVDLLKKENTIPFIARYRKEITGNLDEVEIRAISEALNRLENLEKRRLTILNSIYESGNLTEELKQRLLKAKSATMLEDLYRPYRPKKRTRAMAAKEKGLEPLAELILSQPIDQGSIEDLVHPYLNEGLTDSDEAISGASDIIAEMLNENVEVRQAVRDNVAKFGKIISEKRSGMNDKRQVYKDYQDFDGLLKKLRPHQVLAINRGEKHKILRVRIHIDDKYWKEIILKEYTANKKSNFHDTLLSAIEDGANRLLLPSISREIRKELTENAEAHAINVFSKNLKSLLLQAPIPDHTILGIDPGFRTGCKVAVIDPNGNLLDTATIYPHPPQNQLESAYSILLDLINKFHVTLIVIGNGTASRKTEQFIAEITKTNNSLNYMITSEAGASVYSASETARSEFPDLDVSVRGAVSIARRVQDPLAELVKIDPRSIGVGLYQHDINQSGLSEALDQVIESVVNSVGVEINTASAALLAHVAGIGKHVAKKIVEYREEHGSFSNRNAFLKVPGIGSKTFEQAAGFLRIQDSDDPLDQTAIHPESYPLANKILKKFDITENISSVERSKIITRIKNTADLQSLARELNSGLPTLQDILDEFLHPGRDPREALPKPIFRNDVMKMEDLTPGIHLKGTIRNVVDFGAFVDIGVKIDGLLHRSKISRDVKLKVGDVIDLIIISVDHKRNRIALGMKEKTR